MRRRICLHNVKTSLCGLGKKTNIFACHSCVKFLCACARLRVRTPTHASITQKGPGIWKCVWGGATAAVCDPAAYISSLISPPIRVRETGVWKGQCGGSKGKGSPEVRKSCQHERWQGLGFRRSALITKEQKWFADPAAAPDGQIRVADHSSPDKNVHNLKVGSATLIMDLYCNLKRSSLTLGVVPHPSSWERDQWSRGTWSWEPDQPTSSWFICFGRCLRPPSHSNRFPSNQNLVGSITTLYLIWGGFSTICTEQHRWIIFINNLDERSVVALIGCIYPMISNGIAMPFWSAPVDKAPWKLKLN